MPNVHSKTSTLATFVQDGFKYPSVTTGDISIEVMFEYTKGARKYFNNKEVPDNKQVKKILDCFDDHRIADWIAIHRKHLEDLSFADFMSELCSLYLQPLWEEMTCAKFLSLVQGMKCFWDFTTEGQKTNALFKGTPSYKDPKAVHEQIEGGMDQVFFMRCVEEKADKITHENDLEMLRIWLEEVKRIDDKM